MLSRGNLGTNRSVPNLGLAITSMDTLTLERETHSIKAIKLGSDAICFKGWSWARHAEGSHLCINLPALISTIIFNKWSISFVIIRFGIGKLHMKSSWSRQIKLVNSNLLLSSKKWKIRIGRKNRPRADYRILLNMMSSPRVWTCLTSTKGNFEHSADSSFFVSY